jgi:hypothetical protein
MIILKNSIYVSLFRLFSYHLKELLELVLGHFGIQVELFLLVFLIRILSLRIRHVSIKGKHFDNIFKLKLDFEPLQGVAEAIYCNGPIWLADLSKNGLDFLISHYFVTSVIFLFILRLGWPFDLIGLACCPADFSFYDWPCLCIWYWLGILRKWFGYFTLLLRLLTLVAHRICLIVSEQIVIIGVIIIKESIIILLFFIGMLGNLLTDDFHVLIDDQARLKHFADPFEVQFTIIIVHTSQIIMGNI